MPRQIFSLSSEVRRYDSDSKGSLGLRSDVIHDNIHHMFSILVKEFSENRQCDRDRASLDSKMKYQKTRTS